MPVLLRDAGMAHGVTREVEPVLVAAGNLARLAVAVVNAAS